MTANNSTNNSFLFLFFVSDLKIVYHRRIGQMGRVFANNPEALGSISGRVIP